MNDPSAAPMRTLTGPKIELHVHLEGTVRPATLLEMARRNDEALPARTVEGIAELYRFRDFNHFLKVWILTTHVMRTEADFRQIVVEYAAEAARQGAVYLEGIFSRYEDADEQLAASRLLDDATWPCKAKMRTRLHNDVDRYVDIPNPLHGVRE